MIDSPIDRNINISKYYPLPGSSYIKLPKELDLLKEVQLFLKILMIVNALSSVYSDTYILQIKTKKEVQKLTKIRDKHQSKLEINTKLKKQNSFGNSASG